ncbi:hypothetical protein C0Z16_17235 [Paraburkholderia rhynchosiae]|uniref:Uncharacterized protein n=1 Tax=Paraburkholderia rhynchosiae TaxID=487049 RepID=A0ABX4V5C3_9BURK|nr:hypothetical protein C0Z16_17235 [Paraburkholderia rhynchosiae]
MRHAGTDWPCASGTLDLLPGDKLEVPDTLSPRSKVLVRIVRADASVHAIGATPARFICDADR